MRIAFRADASVQIGTGHVMRCLTLAEELRREGHHCLFICRNHEGHLADLIAHKGFELHLLPVLDKLETFGTREPALAHSHWLGVPWETDNTQTREVLARNNIDWLIVDHYALDARWERLLAEAVDQIMVIDDLADREHECAVLLDQNVLDDATRRRYETKVNKGCKLLLGPQYALLRPEYELLANALPERDGVISRVLVFVGGSDPYHLTERYLKAVSTPEFSNLFLDVVIGKNHPSPIDVEQLVDERAKTRLFAGLPSLAALMVRADLMLGAGGATNWERMCLGLNALVVGVAKNQERINEALGDKSMLHFLGHVEHVTVEYIQGMLRAVIEDPILVSKQSIRARNLVDGNGCERVSQLLSGKCL